MGKPLAEYVYAAHRIDPDHPQNLGAYSIRRRIDEWTILMYHFNPKNGRLINRASMSMPVISEGSRIYTECMRAIDRLHALEAVEAQASEARSNRYEHIYKVLTETHRSDSESDEPIIADHYDRVNLANILSQQPSEAEAS